MHNNPKQSMHNNPKEVENRIKHIFNEDAAELPPFPELT